MKTIVCYGDSNTWGADPAGGPRFPLDVRWTGRLATELGIGYRIVEEGLGGRTTNIDDNIEFNRNGMAQLAPCLDSHNPIDLITIMLGTNDLKARFNRSASDIAQAAVALAHIAHKSLTGPDRTSPRILVIAPPSITTLTDYDMMFAGGLEKSQQWSRYYRAFATSSGYDFLNADDIVASSPVDGIHWDVSEHAKFATALAGKIRSMLG